MGLKLATEKKWADAAKELEKIPDDSPIAADSRPLYDFVVNEEAYGLVVAALAAYDKKDFATAKANIEKALVMDAFVQDGPLLAWKAAIERALLPDADTHDVADPSDPKNTKKAPPLDFKPFFTAYGKSDFQSALSFLDDASP